MTGARLHTFVSTSTSSRDLSLYTTTDTRHRQSRRNIGHVFPAILPTGRSAVSAAEVCASLPVFYNHAREHDQMIYVQPARRGVLDLQDRAAFREFADVGTWISEQTDVNPTATAHPQANTAARHRASRCTTARRRDNSRRCSISRRRRRRRRRVGGVWVLGE